MRPLAAALVAMLLWAGIIFGVLCLVRFANAQLVIEPTGTHWWVEGRVRTGPTHFVNLDDDNANAGEGTSVYCDDCLPTNPATQGVLGQDGNICRRERTGGVLQWNCSAGCDNTCSDFVCPAGSIAIGHDANCDIVCGMPTCLNNVCPAGQVVIGQDPSCNPICGNVPTSTTGAPTTTTSTTTGTTATTMAGSTTTTSTTVASTTSTTIALLNTGTVYTSGWIAPSAGDGFSAWATDNTTAVGTPLLVPGRSRIRLLHCVVSEAPGGSGSWSFNVTISNSPFDEAGFGDTIFVCTIPVGVSTDKCKDLLNADASTMQQGELITFHAAVASGAPTATHARCAVQLEAPP